MWYETGVRNQPTNQSSWMSITIYKSIYLLYIVEVALHALDGHLLSTLDRLGFEHLREGALTQLSYQSVLYT